VSNLAFSPSGTHLLAASRGDNYEDKGILRIWDIGELGRAASEQVTSVSSSASASSGSLAQRVDESIRRKNWDEARTLLRQADVLSGEDARTGYYPCNTSYPYVRFLRGHAGRINSVAVSPDGRKALTASDDGTAWIWDLGSSRQEAVLDGRGTPLLSATFSSDGRQALVVGGDHTVRIYDLSRGTPVLEVVGQDSPVDLAALHRKRHMLATASGDQVILWDARSGRRINVLAHHDGVIAVAFSSDDVLTATQDGTFQRWAVKGGEPSKRLNRGRVASTIVFVAGYLDNLHDVALTCAPDGTARLWDIGESVCLGIAREHAGNVVSVADCRLGEGGAVRQVVTACDDGNAYLWNLESGRWERRVPCPSMSAKTVAYSPRMNCMLTAGKENEIQVWTTERKAQN
jgi:WD40 repeat protein